MVIWRLGNPEGVFDIVRETGEIRLAKLIDFESKQLYTLIVKAQNKPPDTLSSTATININVIDVNDNSPVFDSSPITRFISENSDHSMVSCQIFSVLLTFAA